VLMSLEKLSVLRIENNLLAIPSHILRQGWGEKYHDAGNPKTILDYYFSLDSN